MNISTQLSAPQHLISLATSAILAHVEVGVFNTKKANKAKANEVAVDVNAASTQYVAVTENILVHPLMDAVIQSRSRLYGLKAQYGFEFMGAMYLIPMGRLDAFTAAYKAEEKVFLDAVESLCQHYSSIISDMAFGRGQLFNRGDYLSVEQFRSKFFCYLHQADVPMGDFRVQISTALADDLQKNFQQQVDRMVNNMTKQMAGSVLSYARRLVNSTTDSVATKSRKQKDGTSRDEQVVVRGRVHESTLTDAAEFVSMLKEFNPTGCSELAEAAALLEQALTGVTAETLRTSEVQREEVRQQAQAILDKFSSVSLFDEC